MEVATSSINGKHLDGFMEVSSDFITSLTSRRDPRFFGPEQAEDSDNLVPAEKENDVEDNDRNGSHVEIFYAIKTITDEGSRVEKHAESVVASAVENASNTDGVSDENSGNLVSTENENGVDGNESSGSDVEIIDEIQKVKYKGATLEKQAESVAVITLNEDTASCTDGVSHDDSSPNTSLNVSNRNSGNEKNRNMDHDYCNNNSKNNLVISRKDVCMPNNSSVNSESNRKKPVYLSYQKIISIPEKQFRDQLSSSFSFLDYRLHCTICDLHIGARSSIFSDEEMAALHPSLGVLICYKCMTKARFGRLNPLLNKDSNFYHVCSWCNKLQRDSTGVVAHVQRCTECPATFCESCIKRNLGNVELQSVRKKIDWLCYECNKQPIWRLRLIAWEIVNYMLRKRAIMRKKFPNAKPGEVEDLDLSRCCPIAVKRLLQPSRTMHVEICEPPMEQSRSATPQLPSTTVHVERSKPTDHNPTNPNHLLRRLLAPEPPMEQTSYVTPLFSLTSDSVSQSSIGSNLNNGNITSVIRNIQSYYINNIKNYQRGSCRTQSPSEVFLIGNRTQNGKQSGFKRKPAVENRSSRISWAHDVITKSYALMDSCRKRLLLIEQFLHNPNPQKDFEIKAANLLHIFAKSASSRFQEIESHILENYWSARNKIEHGRVLSYDTIAQEYASLIQESDNTEFDPGSFLEVEINGNKKMKCSEEPAHEELVNCDYKTPIVKLDRCDELLKSFESTQSSNSNQSKLSSPFKATKRNSLQYSKKIKDLIEKHGITESMVVVVPLENLKISK